MTAQELKNSVLQLAVQGKLVPQCKDDEPASKLLKRIRTEKKKLGIKEKPLSEITEDEIPFDIPGSWVWARLNDISSITSGGTPARTNSSFWNGNIPWVKIGDIRNKYISTTEEKISEQGLNSSSAKIFPKGTILYTIFATIGTVGILNIDAATNQAVAGVTFFGEYSRDYMYYVLIGLKDILVSKGKGMAQMNINLTILKNTPIPIPPLDEQKRIVEKIEELMPLIEEYGKAEEQLSKLNAEFPDKLRKSILQQAVQGKLTERDPADEPASVLLKRIKAEKEALIKSGKIKKEKPLPAITDDEKPFDIPEQWCSVRIGDVGIYKKGPFGSSLTKSMFVPKSPGAVKVYEQKNAIQKDHTLGEYYITRDYFDKKMRGFEIFPGDIIVSCAGTIGETYVMPQNIDQGIINQALMRMKIVPSVDLDYFLLYFDYILKSEAQNSSKGSAIKNIPPFEILKNMVLPIPPLAEQKRIVKRVEELLALCDELKGE